MAAPAERNCGEQPIARILHAKGLKPHDLVVQDPVSLTHKLISRACKGRWLTLRSRLKVLNALNRATGENYPLTDLFNY